MHLSNKNIFNNNYSKFKNLLFTFSFILFLVFWILKTSMLVYFVSNIVFVTILSLSITGLLLTILFFTEFNVLEIFCSSLLLIASIINFMIIKNYEILFYTILIIACKDISFRKLVKVHFITNASFLIVLTSLSTLGIIDDLVFIAGNRIRHSMGLLYPTVYSARVFFIVVSYTFLRKFKINFIEFIFLLSIVIKVYIFTDGRLDTLLAIILLVFSFFSNKININILKYLSFIGIFSPIIASIISYFSSKFYNFSSTFMVEINNLFSNRLSLGYRAINMYDIKLFGQKIYEQGNGGISGLKNVINEYFFIDSSYLSLMIKNGGIFFLIVIMISTFKLKKYYDQKMYTFIIVFSIVAINSMVSTFYYNAAVNSIILFMLTKINLESSEHNRHG